jgi:hypothetical protein
MEQRDTAPVFLNPILLLMRLLECVLDDALHEEGIRQQVIAGGGDILHSAGPPDIARLQLPILGIGQHL